MDRKTFDQLNTDALTTAIDSLLPNGGGGTITESRLRSVLNNLVATVATNSRAYELLGIRTADEMAEEWRVGKRRAQQFIADLHGRFGVGRKIGNVWCLSADEIRTHRPAAKAGRPRKVRLTYEQWLNINAPKHELNVSRKQLAAIVVGLGGAITGANKETLASIGETQFKIDRRTCCIVYGHHPGLDIENNIAIWYPLLFTADIHGGAHINAIAAALGFEPISKPLPEPLDIPDPIPADWMPKFKSETRRAR